MAPARTSTGATRMLKVLGRMETAGQSSISMMENKCSGDMRGLQGGEGEKEGD